MSYCKTISDHLDKSDVYVLYHDVDRWNHIRFCEVPNYNKLKPLSLNGGAETVLKVISENDAHYVFLDITSDEIETYSKELGYDIRSGLVY